MRNVLFVCTQNAGRSQMAQAFFERYAPPDLRAESAGLEPAERIHPPVVEAMKEVGIDISERHPKSIEEVRAIRDDIAGRVDDLLLNRVEEVRADNTAHAVRLARLLPNLIAEFEAQRTPEEIRECADAVLAHYDDAQLRSHVLTLAQRRARECLRAPTCYELEVA